MINTIVVDELIEADKETVRRLLVESYQQYEHEYSNPEAWEGYLKILNPRWIIHMLIRCWLQSAIRISLAHYSFFIHLKKHMKSRNLGFFTNHSVVGRSSRIKGTRYRAGIIKG